MIKKINYEMAQQILREMPNEKKQSLKKALDRNLYLTSAKVMSIGEMTIYKEGWFLVLYGTRCRFSVFAKDDDGELVFIRKPNENKLHKLYQQTLHFNECDFYNF